MAVTGNLADLSLMGLIQVICQQGSAARLTLQQDQQQAVIFFNAGDIVEATCNGHHGEDAFYQLLAWDNADFSLDATATPPPRTIHTPWSNLLLEGYSRLDEAADAVFTVDDDDDFAQAFDASEPPPADTLPPPSAINRLLQQLAAEIPGCLAALVVRHDGLGLGHYTAHNTNPDAVAAQAMLASNLAKTISENNQAGGVQDILVNTSHTSLVNHLLDGKFWLGVLTTRQSAPGHVRLLMQEYSPRLKQALAA